MALQTAYCQEHVVRICRVTGGQSLHAVWRLLCGETCRPFGLSAWIVVFSSVQLFLSQVGKP